MESVRKDLRRGYNAVKRYVVAQFLLTLTYVAIAWFVIHLANRVPVEYEKAKGRKADGLYVWEEVCRGGTRVSPRHVSCEAAHDDASLVPMSVALEAVVRHALHDLNVFSWIGCTPGSACNFVMWKALDYTLTNWFTALCVVTLFVGFYLWMAHGARQQYLQYAMMQRQLASDGMSMSHLAAISAHPVELEQPRFPNNRSV